MSNNAARLESDVRYALRDDHEMTTSQGIESNGLSEAINQNTDTIRSIVGNCSTESVVGYWLVQNLVHDYRPPGLLSPAKQILYLMGLLVESPETNTTREFGDGDRIHTTQALEGAFNAYMMLYFPGQGSLAEQTEQWHKIRRVAMGAFANYFNQTLLITPEQASERIESYLTRFDAELTEDLGISATRALEIAWWIANRLQEGLDEFQENPAEAASRLGKIAYSDLVAHFGSEGEVFWQLFSVGRGNGCPVEYPTERTVVEERPLIRISDDLAMTFNVHLLFTSILMRGEECLASGSYREGYFRHRDRVTEDQVVEAFQRILGDDIEIYRNLFETDDSQNEHDLVIVSSLLCLLVEVKASPPVKPFRDPDKAYERVTRAFHSDRGIQSAYNQAMRLMRLIEQNETVLLYDRRGNEVLRLSDDIVSRTFCVTVTRDNHGPLATFLSLLLEKADGDPYPWAVNLLDLQNLAEAWQYFRWDGRQLRAFLSQRVKLNEIVFSHDELDYVGAFIRHCGLHHFERQDIDFTQLDASYSDIFDEIHGHMFYGTPAIRINPIYPFISDVGESIRQRRTVFDSDASGHAIKVGRNEDCPCDSEVKFKRCHGR